MTNNAPASVQVAPSSVVVRLLRHEEIPALAAAVLDFDTAHFENRWREQLQGLREFYVAELDSELVGTVSLGLTPTQPGSLHLFALEVATKRRGQGIGTQVIQYVLDEARRRQLKRVHLEVRTNNPARRLYHRLGFRSYGQEFINSWVQYYDNGFYERVEDEYSVRMAKRLKD